MLAAQLCLTLYNTMESNPPGSSVRGILQARILEWVAISSPGDCPNPGIESWSPELQADALPSELPTGSHKTGLTTCNNAVRQWFSWTNFLF